MEGRRRLNLFAAVLVAFWLTPHTGAGLGVGAPPWHHQRDLPTGQADPAATGSGPLVPQETIPDPDRTLILMESPSAEARRTAAESLASDGSPLSIEALRHALRDDPDPSVQATAAESLGSLGPLALTALPDLFLALDRGGADGSVCLAAARALGRLGFLAVDGIQPLGRASATRCSGAGDGPLDALAAIASDVSARARSLPSEELTGLIEEFRTLEKELGLPFPPGVTRSLGSIESVLRARRPGRLSEISGFAALLVGTIASALRSVGGILAAILAVGLVILGLRRAGRILPRLLPTGTDLGFPLPKWGILEQWFRCPRDVRVPYVAGPSAVATLLRKKAGEAGIALTENDRVLAEYWDRFVGTAATGRIPSFAAERWIEVVLDHAREGRELSPPESMVDVVLGEIDARYGAGAGPEAPPKDLVTQAVQAIAWRTIQGGSLTGWVRVAELGPMGSAPDAEVLLAYAEEKINLVKRDSRRRRVRLSTDEDVTARLGSLHLMRSGASSPADILGHLGALQAAAIEKVGRAQAPAFLRTVAGAMLEAAKGLEGGEPDLGIAEAALMELAEGGGSSQPGGVSGPLGRGGSAPVSVGLPQRGGAVRGAVDPGRDRAPRAGRPDNFRLRRLQERLQSERHPAVRERILRAIGEMGPAAQPALPALLESIEKDPANVAVAAVDAVGRIGPAASRAAPLLAESLERGHLDLRVAATRALGRLGPSGAAAAPVLMRWTSEGGVPHELRARAAEALGGMPGEGNTSIPALTELLRSEVALEVRAAAALALARLDTGRRDVDEALRWAHRSEDPSLRGMVGIAIWVRDRRLGTQPKARGNGPDLRWLGPVAATAGVLCVLELVALLGTQLLTPGSVLPVLFVTPAFAFLGGIAYGVTTRHRGGHPALGGGVSGWAGTSAGLLLGLLFTAVLTPLALVAGGGLALGSGALGGMLVRTALGEL